MAINVGDLFFGKINQRVDGLALGADFKMQKLFITGISTHFSNFLTGRHLLAFIHQTDFIVGIGTEHFLAVLDDNQLTITNQTIAAIYNQATG